MTVDRSALPYRPCVGVMLLNEAGKAWVGRRIDMPKDPEGGGNWWQMPQGGIDADETPEQAARRELFEETNVHSVALLEELPDWLSYDLPDELVGVAWKGRYRGQKQKWFAFRFTGEDSEIDVHAPGRGAHKAEFDAWQWVRLQELPSLIVPFKRDVYVRVSAAFSHLGNRLGEA